MCCIQYIERVRVYTRSLTFPDQPWFKKPSKKGLSLDTFYCLSQAVKFLSDQCLLYVVRDLIFSYFACHLGTHKWNLQHLGQRSGLSWTFEKEIALKKKGRYLNVLSIPRHKRCCRLVWQCLCARKLRQGASFSSSLSLCVYVWTAQFLENSMAGRKYTLRVCPSALNEISGLPGKCPTCFHTITEC